MKKYVTTMSFPQFSRNLDAMVPFLYAVNLVSEETFLTPYSKRTCARLLSLYSAQLKRRTAYCKKYTTDYYIHFSKNGQIYEADSTHVPYTHGFHELQAFCMALSVCPYVNGVYMSYFLEECREKVL